MRLRGPLIAGFVAGIVLANCGKPPVDPKTLNGTALFVTCTYKSSLHVRQFLFTGEISGGNDAFPAGYLPDPASGSDLSGPQTARILLNDALKDQDVALTVYALDLNGEIVEVGYATAKAELGREVDVQVDLMPFVVAVPDGGMDAGPGVDAGFDAGTLDAGKRDDGGTVCDCNGGCCILGANPDGGSCAPTTQNANAMVSPPVVLTSQFCGKSNQACVPTDFCDPLRSNTCAGPKCSCGASGAPCPDGMRCAPMGGNGTVYSCVCDKFSNCDGCCVNQASACIKATLISCGAAGQQCATCSNATGVGRCDGTPVWGVGACSSFSGCATCKGVKECCSGNSCQGFGFPTCRAEAAGLPSVCDSCDVVKANQCHPVTGQCACGDAGPCGPGHHCKDGQCRQLF